jgi:BNR repeat-like domain/RTX calcium-binding nonapeptide repeat (4 copies)
MALAAALVASVGVASAAIIQGTNGPDRLRGTASSDALYGRRGNDRVSGLAGSDLLDGGSGRDILSGGAGSDRIESGGDSARDSVSCGGGRDVVNAELMDRVAADCEVVSRQLSHDPYTNPESQHDTQVEPGSAAWGSTVVAVFQSGRDFGGGASNIGFARSPDGGTSWRSGFLPGLTVLSVPAGTATRASDPSVAYDAVHATWLAATLAVAPRATDLLVNRSRDALVWSMPVSVAHSSSMSLAYDKPWIACDNSPLSQLRGRCYLAYTDESDGQLGIRTSDDGGQTWEPGGRVPVPPGNGRRGIVGALPVPRRDGSLVVAYQTEPGSITATRSNDGAKTFSAPVTVAQISDADVHGIRSEPLPSVAVDGAGRLYAVWQDCRFRSRCGQNDVVLSTSADGIAWSRPKRVTPPGGTGSSAFAPAIGGDPASPAARVRLAATYYVRHQRRCSGAACTVDAYRVTSTNGGRTWSSPDRLTARAMRPAWMPDTTAGRMLGDYISTSYARGRAVSVYAIAAPILGGSFKQAIFATQPPR